MTSHTELGCGQDYCINLRLDREMLDLPLNLEKCIHFGDNMQCSREIEGAKLKTLIRANDTLQNN